MGIDIGDHLHHRQNADFKHDLFHEVGVLGQGIVSLGQGIREEEPGHETGHQPEDIGKLDSVRQPRSLGFQSFFEGEPVHEDHDDGLHEAPDHTEEAAGKTALEVVSRQAADQLAVFKNGTEGAEHTSHNSTTFPV